jgi:hypothetical protein
MTAFALTSCTITAGTAWTGTAPGTAAAASGTINTGTDISSMITSIELALNWDEIEYTNFASGGWREVTSGLGNGNVSVTFNDSYAASNVDALFGLGGTFGPTVQPIYLDVRPTSAARGSTNPSYVMLIRNFGGTLLGGSVGSLATKSMTFRLSGRPTRLTS